MTREKAEAEAAATLRAAVETQECQIAEDCGQAEVGPLEAAGTVLPEASDQAICIYVHIYIWRFLICRSEGT